MSADELFDDTGKQPSIFDNVLLSVASLDRIEEIGRLQAIAELFVVNATDNDDLGPSQCR